MLLACILVTQVIFIFVLYLTYGVIDPHIIVRMDCNDKINSCQASFDVSLKKFYELFTFRTTSLLYLYHRASSLGTYALV